MSDGDADALLQALLAAPSVLLTGPSSADGDSLGASLALATVLRHRGVQVDVTGDPGWRYGFLPGAAALLNDGDLDRVWHTVVILDGDQHRLTPGVQRAWQRAAVRAIVDHHASTAAGEYDIAWLDPGATSTCQMIYGAARRWGTPLDRDLATLLHVGTVFDTGCFRYDNTRPDTLAMTADLLGHGIAHADIVTRTLQARRWQGLQAFARLLQGARRCLDGRLIVAHVPLALQRELGLERDDLEGVVEALADVVGCDVGALIVHRADGGTKVSLRSRDSVDVCAIAMALTPTGGGHRKAAGALTDQAPDRVDARLQDLVAQALPERATDR